MTPKFKLSPCSSMYSIVVRALSLALAAAGVLAAPPTNPPTLVNLRIEGLDHTIYEAPILTYGHNITTPSGGTHHCDGTNLNANPKPGPTCTSALDNASKLWKFPYDGCVMLLQWWKTAQSLSFPVSTALIRKALMTTSSPVSVILLRPTLNSGASSVLGPPSP